MFFAFLLRIPYRNRMPLEWCLLWKLRLGVFVVWLVVLVLGVCFFPMCEILENEILYLVAFLSLTQILSNS